MLVLIILISSNFQLHSQLSERRIRRIGATDGLSGSIVLSIARDKFGFTWIGTSRGLDRFDGVRIKHYRAGKATGLPSDKDISLLYTDNKGGLWVVSNNTLLLAYDYDTDGFKLIADLSSSGHISSLLLDDNDNFWVGTYNGLYTWDSIHNRQSLSGTRPFSYTYFSKMQISFLKEDANSVIWIGLSQAGLGKLSLRNGKTLMARYYLTSPDNNKPYPVLSGMVIDKFHCNWFISGGQLIKLPGELFNLDTGTIYLKVKPEHFYQPEEKVNFILSIEYDGNSNLFIQVYNTIYRFNIIEKQFRKCFQVTPSFIESNDTHWAFYYSGNDKLLWTSIIGGLAILDTREVRFGTIRHDPVDPFSLSSNELVNYYFDSQDKLWAFTHRAGIDIGVKNRNRGTYTFEHYFPIKKSKTNKAGNWINSIYITEKEEIFIITNSIQRVNYNKGKMTCTEFRKSYNYLANPVSEIQNIGGFYWIIPMRNTIILTHGEASSDQELYLNDKKIPFAAESLFLTPDSQLIVHGMNGIFYRLHLPLVRVGNRGFRPSSYEALNDTDLSLKNAIYMLCTYHNRLNYFWFTQSNTVILKYVLEESTGRNSTLEDKKARLSFVRKYDQRDGLPESFIRCIIEDKKENLWIFALNGLSCLLKGDSLVHNFSPGDGLPESRNIDQIGMDSAGSLYMKCPDGIFYFNPDSLIASYSRPKAIISSILVSGIAMPVIREGHAISYMNKKGSVVIPFKKNQITLELSRLEFLPREGSYFRYKMDGMDRDWRVESTGNQVSYGVLPPGKYRFHLYSVLSSGLKKSDEVTLDILVKTPFYRSGLFYFLLFLAACFLVYAVMKVRERELKARAAWLERTIQKKTTEVLQEREQVDQMKTRFYTNISHEFRTPLTLIMGSANELTGMAESSGNSRFISTIKNASQRLLKLVNELLDLAKLEAGNLKLRTEFIDITREIKIIIKIHFSDAERRKIKLSFSSEPEVIFGWFDREFIQKIMHNLISNALKFTSNEGEIKVQIQIVNEAIENRAVKILIIDTGKGIATEDLSRIFDRFYQVEDSDKKSAEGTGIGLSIVQELVQRHHGTIQVESTLGQGTSFVIILPCGSRSFAVDEMIQTSQENGTAGAKDDEEILAQPVQDSGEKPLQKVKSKEGSTILLAEDNDELRDYLAEALGKKYNVIMAENGQAAFEKARDLLPDIIVSDIMMPISDGLILCQQVKENDLTCHIPVILLTAKADMDSRLEGLHTGADDYLVKPFNLEELMVRIENVLVQREKLKQKFARLNFMEKQSHGEQSRDDEFLSKIVSKIEMNLVRTDFNVVNLAAEMNLSQRSLERKIHALTDLTPVEFLRRVRIKYAARLIAEGRTDVSGAAYESGFLSLSYFSRVFTEIIGVKPAEYLKSMEKQKANS
jgi:signal transduction histidine kinase/DNA-binding response OmpR family regulator